MQLKTAIFSTARSARSVAHCCFFFFVCKPTCLCGCKSIQTGTLIKTTYQIFLGSVTLFFWRVYLYFIPFTKLIHCIAEKKTWTGTILRLLEGKPNEKGTEILPLVIKKFWLMTQLQFCVYSGGSDSLMPVLAILVSQTNIGPSNLWSDSSYCSQGFISVGLMALPREKVSILEESFVENNLWRTAGSPCQRGQRL